MSEKEEKKNVGKKRAKVEKVAKDDRTITQRLNSFFKTNNYLIVIMLLMMMILTMCDNRSYKEETVSEIKEATKYLKKNISTIGYVGANGVLATIDRKTVDYHDDRIKNIITNDVTEPFLQGAKEIKGKKVFKNTKAMVKGNEQFYNLYYYKTKNKTEMSRVLGAIFKMISSLYYPEYVTVLKKKINSFHISKDPKVKDRMIFHGSVQYNLSTKSWIPQLNKWVDEEVTMNIDFAGEIDPAEYASSNNLLGYQITKISVPLLSKPSMSDLRVNQ